MQLDLNTSNLLEEIQGEPRVSSMVIAENIGVKHESVRDIISKYKIQFNEFGKISTTDFKSVDGKMSKTVFMLNENQSSFLFTLMRNNEIVVRFKVSLIKAFDYMKKELQNKKLPFDLNDPVSVLGYAQNIAIENKELKQREIENKPLVSFAKSVEASINSVLIREWVKTVSKHEGVNIGQNRAFMWLRYNKYLMNNNEPYQRYLDNGYFEYIPRTVASTKGTHEVFTTKITGKGQIALAEKIVKDFK